MKLEEILGSTPPHSPSQMERTVDSVTLELIQGDIAHQMGIDAVVNAVNAELMPGGGVAGAIHRAAGPGLAEECRPLAPIKPGQCVITRGHGLPNSYVIHCLGPVHGKDQPEAALLADCYRRALALAEEKGLASVAFPAISTGAFGYPIEEAAEIALRTVIDSSPGLRTVRRIRFVLFSRSDLDVCERALSRMLG